MPWYILGTCSDLYTSDEIRKLATMMTPGQVKLTKLDKIETSFNKFTERVRQNLHVAVCLNMTSKPIFLSTIINVKSIACFIVYDHSYAIHIPIRVRWLFQQANIILILICYAGTNAYSAPTTELRPTLSTFPSLLRHACHVDVYRPWTQEAYVTVAEQWLQEPFDQVKLLYK